MLLHARAHDSGWITDDMSTFTLPSLGSEAAGTSLTVESGHSTRLGCHSLPPLVFLVPRQQRPTQPLHSPPPQAGMQSRASLSNHHLPPHTVAGALWGALAGTAKSREPTLAVMCVNVSR